MLDLMDAFILPAAFEILPAWMTTLDAHALLLAIGLQESGFQTRRQAGNGPARGFWQFEISAVTDVIAASSTHQAMSDALDSLRYPRQMPLRDVLAALEHHDVLAACAARCLLARSLLSLPGPEEADQGWAVYQACWRPGQPKPDTWASHFDVAWAKATA